MHWEMYLLIAAVAGGVVIALELVLLTIVLLQRRRFRRLDDRVAHLSAAVTLLTDTIETGLQDVAREMARIAAAPRGSASRARSATQRRVRTASRRGRSIVDIASSEQMSEGEVRLLLQMAGPDGREVMHDAPLR